MRPALQLWGPAHMRAFGKSAAGLRPCKVPCFRLAGGGQSPQPQDVTVYFFQLLENIPALAVI